MKGLRFTHGENERVETEETERQGKAKKSHGYPQDSLGKRFRSPGAGELS